MTREEAKNQFSNELLERAMGFKKGKLKIGAVYKIIDDIYDDFENRKCKNCIYLTVELRNGKVIDYSEYDEYLEELKSYGVDVRSSDFEIAAYFCGNGYNDQRWRCNERMEVSLDFGCNRFKRGEKGQEKRL